MVATYVCTIELWGNAVGAYIDTLKQLVGFAKAHRGGENGGEIWNSEMFEQSEVVRGSCTVSDV